MLPWWTPKHATDVLASLKRDVFSALAVGPPLGVSGRTAPRRDAPYPDVQVAYLAAQHHTFIHRG